MAKGGSAWIVPPFALMLSVSIAGIGSAWLGGSARIPFVAGLDSYLPQVAGQAASSIRHSVHCPDRARQCFHAAMPHYLVGARVQEAFQTMLSLAVVLQLVPFLYMFAALLKLAWGDAAGEGPVWQGRAHTRRHKRLATTILGIALVFFPAQQITSLWLYEVKMCGGHAVLCRTRGILFLCVRSAQGAAGNHIERC